MYDPYSPEQQYVRHAPANELRLVAAAIDSVSRPSAFLQETVQRQETALIPAEEALALDHYARVPVIQDMFSADDRWGNSRVDFSQRLSGYSGTSYPSLNQY